MRNKKIFYGFFYFLYLEGLKGIEHGVNYGSVDLGGEDYLLKFVKGLASRPLVIDGGANKGQFTTLANEILNENCNVHCFEPSRFTFNTLQQNTTRFKNVILNQKGLGDEPKKLTLRYDEKGSELASLIDLNYKHYGLELSQKEEVEIISLDSYCKQNAIEHINLFKLDIEGYEFIALKGASDLIVQGKIDVIQWEMGRPNVDSRHFYKDFHCLLCDRYNIYQLLSWGLKPMPHYSYEFEIFLGCNYAAIRKEVDRKH